MSKRVDRRVVLSFRALSLGVLAFGALSCAGLFLTGCSGDSDEDAALEVMDLDPSSAGASVVVESITADASGRLYVADRVSGVVWQIDPAAESRSVVAAIAPRQVGDADPLKPDPAGMTFDPQGNLLIASGPFGEVLRVAAADLDAATPGRARTFVTGVPGANAILLDPQGRLYVSGGANGNIYRANPQGGEAEMFAQIEAYSRAVPPDGFMQTVVANGLAFDASGALLVADTARGAIWKIAVGIAGSAGEPTRMVSSPMLEGVDGLALNSAGTLWGAVNEQNELVTISPSGLVRQMFKNDSQGPLEYPAAIVFAGGAGYVVNLDRARRDNFADDGTTSLDGVGASIVVLPAAAAAARAPSSNPSAMPPPISSGY